MSDDSSRVSPNSDLPEEHAECVQEAWRLFCEGIHSYRAIARGVNNKSGCSHTHGWVKRNLQKYSQTVRELVDNPQIDALAQYIQGLQRDLTAQAKIANADPEKTSVSIQDRRLARREMTDIREKLAQARGVDTQRQHHEHGGSIEVGGSWWDELEDALGGPEDDDADAEGDNTEE